MSHVTIEVLVEVANIYDLPKRCSYYEHLELMGKVIKYFLKYLKTPFSYKISL